MSAGWAELDATLDKMLGERIARQRSLQADGVNTSFNEGWIDALEHVLGIMRLRATTKAAGDAGLPEDAQQPTHSPIPSTASAAGEMREVLEDVREFLSDQADAEYFTDSAGPVPNKAMRLLVEVDAALSKTEN